MDSHLTRKTDDKEVGPVPSNVGTGHPEELDKLPKVSPLQRIAFPVLVLISPAKFRRIRISHATPLNIHLKLSQAVLCNSGWCP